MIADQVLACQNAEFAKSTTLQNDPKKNTCLHFWQCIWMHTGTLIRQPLALRTEIQMFVFISGICPNMVTNNGSHTLEERLMSTPNCGSINSSTGEYIYTSTFVLTLLLIRKVHSIFTMYSKRINIASFGIQHSQLMLQVVPLFTKFKFTYFLYLWMFANPLQQ